MKKSIYEILFAITLGLLIPVLLLQVLSRNMPKDEETTVIFTQTTIQDVPQSMPALQSEFIDVLLQDGTVRQMELEGYLTCVLLAEVPADFETEALRAQAVVARTYTYKRIHSPHKHDLAAVCADPSCCQAFCDEETYLSDGGTQAEIDKIRSAVADTKSQVLTYNGQLIEATYFSCSGGRTESAAAVWGSDIPYLQAVDSPGEEIAEHYVDTVTFQAAEFESLLGIQPDGQPGSWFGEVTYTDGGGVKTIEIGQTLFDGVTVRQLLGLRSTAFMITAIGQTITVTTKGFGHRVGMSQYGAEAMAVQGADYRQMLEYYYNGTSLDTWQYD